jgi:acyl dehydratase
MPLNRTCLGKTWLGAATEVTRDAIQNYAHACNDDNPRYFNPAGPDGTVAPPLFAAVVTWMPVISALTDPELRADLIRLLHTAQDMEFHAPIRAGDRISATARLAEIVAVAGGEALTLELDATNQNGEQVNRTRFTVLIRVRREAVAVAEPRTDASSAIASGAPLCSVTQTIDRDQTFRYAEASGDRNPIHVDETVAKMAGLPGIIVHGMCAMAFASRAVVDELCGGDPLRLKRLAVRFSRPVFPGDSLTTSIWPDGVLSNRCGYSFATVTAQGLTVMRDGRAEIAT